MALALAASASGRSSALSSRSLTASAVPTCERPQRRLNCPLPNYLKVALAFAACVILKHVMYAAALDRAGYSYTFACAYLLVLVGFHKLAQLRPCTNLN